MLTIKLLLVVFYTFVGIKLLGRFIKAVYKRETFFTEKTTRLITWLLVGHAVIGFIIAVAYYIKTLVIVGM